MKKKLAVFIMAAALVLSMPMASFATDTPTAGTPEQIGAVISDGEMGSRAVASSNVSVDRLSATSGKVTVYAAFTRTVSTAVCTIYLQEKYNGSWRTATGLGTTSYTKTAYNTNSISAGKTFTLISGKTYRAKVVILDTVNGSTSSKTVYSGAF